VCVVVVGSNAATDHNKSRNNQGKRDSGEDELVHDVPYGGCGGLVVPLLCFQDNKGRDAVNRVVYSNSPS
jgi:hypothetical protein